jgi:hypothetical protein
MLNTLLLKERVKKYGPYAAGAAVLIALGAWGASALETKLAISRTEKLLQKGFGALAAESIDHHRKSAVYYKNGCSVMVGAYFASRRLERLEWASEACLDGGKESPEVYLGLAAHRELTGRESEALRILTSVASKYDQIPDIYFRIAQILIRNKSNDAAAQYMLKATERAQGANQIVVEALQFFNSVQKWNEAKLMADRLKSAPTEDPELKLLIARALKNGGDSAGAQAVADQARGMIATKGEIKVAMERAYADVLGPGGGGHSGQGTPPGGSPPAGMMPPPSGIMPPGLPPGGAMPAPGAHQAAPPAKKK